MFALSNTFRPRCCPIMCNNANMAEEINWRRAASQMLRALRGKRSQRAFSLRLRYKSNVASDWESGRRLPTADEALRACQRLAIDVNAAFHHFQPACAAALGNTKQPQVSAWLRELSGGMPISQLATRSNMSRYAISRWLQGKTHPRLHDFLALVEAISGRASDLVAALVPINQVDELRSVATRRATARRLAFDEPWSATVMRVLETTGYQAATHPEGYIATRLGLEVAQVRAVLETMENAGAAQFDGERYQSGAPLTVDVEASPKDIAQLRAHWANVARERAFHVRDADWLGFNIISTSMEDLERVREVLRRAFREIRSIAAASEPAETVALLNLHLVTWEESGSQSAPHE